MRLKPCSTAFRAQLLTCLLVLLAVIHSASTTGCGSGSSGQASTLVDPSARGSVSVVVPGTASQGRGERTVFGREIPATTQSFSIVVQRDGLTLAEKKVARTTQDQTVVIEGMPVGRVNIVVKALDASGAVVAEATLTGYEVVAGLNSPVDVTLTPVSPASPHVSTIFVLHGTGTNPSNKVSILTAQGSSNPRCIAAVDVAASPLPSPSPEGMVRWGTYLSPNPQSANYLYVANGSSTGSGRVTRFVIEPSTGLLTSPVDTPLLAGPYSVSPTFIGPARNTTTPAYTPPPYLYALGSTDLGGAACAITVATSGSISIGVAAAVLANPLSISVLPGTAFGYLTAPSDLYGYSVAAYSAGAGGLLSFVQKDSPGGTYPPSRMRDSLVNSTTSPAYLYMIDQYASTLYYYAIDNATHELTLPATPVALPEAGVRMSLVTRSDFPAGRQYLFIVGSTKVMVLPVDNGIPGAPTGIYPLTLTPATSTGTGAGLDTDPGGQSLWVTANDDINNTFVFVYAISSAGILTPWVGSPTAIQDPGGTPLRGAGTIIVKD